MFFTPDVSELHLNFKKIRVSDHHSVINRVLAVFHRPPRSCPNLSALILKGGTPHTDDLITKIEDLCHRLPEEAVNLKELHLPVCSNYALRSISDMPNLRHLRTDRTRHFNRRGLWHLCHPEAKTRYKLESLHLGVFKHYLFEKLETSKFFMCMKNLTDFSLMDEDRALMKIGTMNMAGAAGEKVLTYSILRLAIIESARSGEDFQCGLRKIKVVDRTLKPKYLLQTCPNLQSLYIDWQEELALPSFRRLERDWFTQMMRDPAWTELANKLVELDIVFPGRHSPNCYSLPLSDLNLLLSTSHNLQVLRLSGAGKEAPIPLLPIFNFCKKLKHLHLDQTFIHVPEDYSYENPQFVSRSLRSFSFIGDMSSSLLLLNNLTKCIGLYMPNLVQLELEPESAHGFRGLTLKQIRDLWPLKELSKLSLPFSMEDCVMNMPQTIFILREFQNLRHFILAWGWAGSDAWFSTVPRASSMLNWLSEALAAENANINLQLNYRLHQGMYGNGSKLFC